MNPRRFVGLMSLIVELGGASVPAYGGDSAAEATLKEKGLFRAGRAFVISPRNKRPPSASRPSLPGWNRPESS